MLRGIYQNAASMQLLEEQVDVIANNMANVDTAGFKKRGVFFQQLITAEEALERNQQDVTLPTGRVATYTDTSDGKIIKTGNPLDIALSGDGWFTLQTASGTAYTRSGEFAINQNGMLVTPQGDFVLGEGGPIQVSNSFSVNEAGGISDSNVLVNSFMLQSFPDGTNFKMQNNYFVPPADAQATTANAQVMQGYIESSNVEIVKEMVSLIRAHRHYDTNQKLITSQDETLRKTVNEIGR